jgi:hypothetical protein
LIFRLDAALLSGHTQYHPPPPTQYHYYRRGRLRLTSDTQIQCRRSDLPPATDATGEPDYGHIDTFHRLDPESPTWELAGDWGQALIAEPVVALDLDL